jgi:hypothetical protein
VHQVQPGNFVERVVAANVFGRKDNFLAIAQGGGMDSAGLFVQVLGLEQFGGQRRRPGPG